jgi:hypothetical protein
MWSVEIMFPKRIAESKTHWYYMLSNQKSHTIHTHTTSNQRKLKWYFSCFANNGQPNSRTAGIVLAVKGFQTILAPFWNFKRLGESQQCVNILDSTKEILIVICINLTQTFTVHLCIFFQSLVVHTQVSSGLKPYSSIEGNDTTDCTFKSPL